MKLSLYMNDYETEKLFSYLRWIFVVVSLVMFKVPTISTQLQLEHNTFDLLLVLCLIYMTVSHVALHRTNSKTKSFSIIVKSGIVFDFIAVFWLLLLSGGVTSPLFPIIFLVVMHSTIYWETKGAFLSSLLTVISYTFILLLQNDLTINDYIIFALNSCFVLVVGLFGALIVLRERKHFRQKEIYYELMVTDYLTGLYNHKSFQEELKFSLGKKDSFVLLMGDIDHFKPINDKYGHLIGDEVLNKLGKLLNEVSLKNQGKAFRYGGEEFALIFPNLQVNEVMGILEELYGRMNDLSFTEDNFKITMSFGIASASSSQSRDEILVNADKLLYEAKRKGKNRAILETGHQYINLPKNFVKEIKTV